MQFPLCDFKIGFDIVAVSAAGHISCQMRPLHSQ